MSETTGTTTVRVPRTLIGELRTIAEAHDRSVSAELRVALDAYVRRNLPEAQRTLKEKAR